MLVFRDPIPVVCFVMENYVIYHLFCNLIRKGLRQVILGLGLLEKGGIFDLGEGKKSWQRLDRKIWSGPVVFVRG